MKSIGIVGAGFVGLFAAIKFKILGYDVDIYEEKLVGAGASTNNHGILHCGANLRLYHPDTADMMFENLKQMDELISNFYIRDYAKYTVVQELSDTFRKTYTSVGENDFLCPDRTVDICRLLNSLYDTCQALGVKIHLHTKVVLGENNTLQANSEKLDQDVVFLSSGNGLSNLVRPDLERRIYKRVSFMMHVPNVDLEPHIHIKKDGLAIVPTPDNQGTLFGRFGGRQPFFRGDYRGAIPMDVVYKLFNDASVTVSTEAINKAYIYPCIKVEFKTSRTDSFGVQLHPTIERVSGLNHQNIYACLPGKWSSAYWITNTLVSDITGQDMSLDMFKEHFIINTGPVNTEIISTPSWKQALTFKYPDDQISSDVSLNKTEFKPHTLNARKE